MKTRSEAVASVRAIFGRGAESFVADALLSHLEEFPSTRHITIGLVHRLMGRLVNDQEIVRALQYLAGEDLALLTLKFEYINENDEPEDIDNEEARSVLDNSINPFTGREDLDAGKKLLIYFEPRALSDE